MIDFMQDLQDAVIVCMNHHGIIYKNNDDQLQLLIKLFTFYQKYIVPRKRKVYVSRELRQHRAIT